MKDYSTYHNTDISTKFENDSQKMIQHYLNNSPESYPVTVNGIAKNIIIQSTSDNSKRVILFQKDSVGLGDLVVHNSLNWLATELPVYNKVYEKSEMTLCNQTLTIEEITEGTITGYDDLSRPITAPPTITTHTFPCVVKSVKEMYSEIGEQINLPDGRIVLYIQYTDNVLIKRGTEFKMFNSKYSIHSVDLSKTLNNKGFVIISADKIT